MSDLSKQAPSSYQRLFVFILFLLLASTTTAGIAAQSRKAKGNDPQKLEVNKAVERELGGGLFDSYELNLKVGQYVKLVVDQRGIDVVITLINPIGGKALEVDSPNGANGEEPLAFITTTAGKYRVEVRSLEKTAATRR